MREAIGEISGTLTIFHISIDDDRHEELVSTTQELTTIEVKKTTKMFNSAIIRGRRLKESLPLFHWVQECTQVRCKTLKNT